MRGCRAFIAATVFSLVASIASPAGAAEPTTDGAFGVVIFAVNPRSRDAQAMVDAVRAHLTGLPVRLVVETGTGGGASASNGTEASNGGSRRILGTLTIDPGTPGEWVVSFTEPAVDTTLVRRIRFRPQGTAVALEEAAIVVRSMVEAILDGGHLGIARPAPAVEETSGAPAAPVVRRGIAITGAYLGTTFAPELGWQSGAQLGVRWQSRELYAGVAYAIFLPIEATEQGVSIRLNRYPGSLVLGYEGAARLAPIVEAELTFDYVRRRTLRAPGFDPTDDDGRWTFGVGVEAGISWLVLPRFRLLAQVGVDWMVNSYAYVVQPSITVMTAAPVRPKAIVGVALDLW